MKLLFLICLTLLSATTHATIIETDNSNLKAMFKLVGAHTESIEIRDLVLSLERTHFVNCDKGFTSTFLPDFTKSVTFATRCFGKSNNVLLRVESTFKEINGEYRFSIKKYSVEFEL